MLYHGSNARISNCLLPHKSFHYKPYVYATSDLHYAIVRAGRFDPKISLFKEDYDGKTYTLIELKPSASEEAFDTDGYVYVVDDNSFSSVKDGLPNEFVSEKPCEIKDTIYIPNVLNYINSSDCYRIIRCGSEREHEYWKTVRGGKEGYLQRRKERAKKLLGDVI